MLKGLKRFFQRHPEERAEKDWTKLSGMEFLQMYGSLAFPLRKAASGVQVTTESALGLPAVFRAVNFLSEKIAMLPFTLYERIGMDGRREARDLPLFRVLQMAANRYQTAMEFWSWMQGQICFFGNGYAEIERARNGNVVALWPRDARYLTWEVVKGRPVYRFDLDGQHREYEADQILHCRAWGDDGFSGRSPVQVCLDAMGLGQALQDFASAFFGNGSWMGGVITVPPGSYKTEEEYQTLKTKLREGYTGAQQAHKLLMLNGGMDLKQMGVAPNDAQALESRTFSVQDVARVFGVPPTELMDFTGAIKANVEQQSIQAKAALQPWGTRLAQRVWMQLLLPSQQERYFAEFDYEYLIQTEIKTRYEAIMTGRQAGILNADEARSDLGRNPLPKGAGKTFWMPANMWPADMIYDLMEAKIKSDSAPKPGTDRTESGDQADGTDGSDGADETDKGSKAPVKDSEEDGDDETTA